MATPQTATRKSAHGNGHDKKAVAARAAKEELATAQEAAETFVSALKSSAGHFGQHVGRAAEEKVVQAQEGAQDAKRKLEDTVRAHPFAALGIAAGAGVLAALLSRR